MSPLIGQIIAAVIGLAIAAAIIVWQELRKKRKALLLARWVEELPNLTHQFRFVPPNMQERTDVGQLSARDIVNVAIANLSDSLVDPAALTVEQRKERFEGAQEYVKRSTIGYAPLFEGRRNFDRLVDRALEILRDTENKYTLEQQVAAELVLTTPHLELTKVKAWDADAYFQKMCGKAAAIAVSQKTGTPESAAAEPQPDRELREAMAERVMARASAAASGIDAAVVHRELPANRAGKIAEIIASIDAALENELYFLKSPTDAKGRSAWQQRIFPLAWAGIGAKDLSLAEAIRLSSALGLDLPALDIEQLEAKCAAATAAPPETASDAWAEFRKSSEPVAARFESLRTVWRVIGARYEHFLMRPFDWKMQLQPASPIPLFSVSFDYLYNDCQHAKLRQVQPDAVLIWDNGPSRESRPEGPSVQLVLAGDSKAVVTWPVRKYEEVDVDAAQVETRMKGLERELRVSLDGALPPEGSPGGTRWAVVTRDRISGEVKNVEARGHAKAASAGA